MKGKLGLLQAAKALQDEILNPQMSFDEDTGLLAAETKLAAECQKDRPDGARHRRAKIHDGAAEPAGGAAQLRRHHNGRISDGIGDPAREEIRREER